MRTKDFQDRVWGAIQHLFDKIAIIEEEIKIIKLDRIGIIHDDVKKTSSEVEELKDAIRELGKTYKRKQ